MEAKEILAKVKEFFSDLTAPAVPATHAPVQLSEYELMGGGKVQIDKLEVGGIVTIDGAPSLPGELELSDGTKMTVTDGGVIAELESKEADTPAAPDANPANDMGAKFTAFETSANEKFASYETKFAAYEQRFADYEVKMAKANKVIEELLKLSTLIVEAPAAKADEVVKTSNTFKDQETGKVKASPILFNS